MLLNTGTLVTLFSESLCNELSNSKERGVVLFWLKLKTANRLSSHYTSYIVADFQVGGVQVPADGVFIVKDDFIGDKKARDECDLGLLGGNFK